MRNIYLVLILFTLIGCTKEEKNDNPNASTGSTEEEKNDNPKASFDYSPNIELKLGDTITFSNNSQYATRYLWNFGDGDTSTLKQPIHLYTSAGEYQVTLLALTESSVDSIKKTIKISPKPYDPSEGSYVDLMDKYLNNWPENSLSYDVDVDKDSLIDLKIIITSFYSRYEGSTSSITLNPSNGYEILYENTNDTIKYYYPSSADTVPKYYSVRIPKRKMLGDSVMINDLFTKDDIMITYLFGSNNNQLETKPYGISRDQWISNNYGYIGLRKVSEKGNKLAWLKVKIPSMTSIILNSCKYFENKDGIVITDKH